MLATEPSSEEAGPEDVTLELDGLAGAAVMLRPWETVLWW